jgi:hypothetical protein
MFDNNPSQKQQQKNYEKAVQTAAHPLNVLSKIKKGTIVPEDIQHLNALYPEMTERLREKLTEKLVHMQISGKKPDYKVRQGLSLLLGAPLSSEMTPANIQAAQGVFRKAASQTQTAAGNAQPKKKLSAVSKSAQAYLLPEDAAASRQQKQ